MLQTHVNLFQMPLKLWLNYTAMSPVTDGIFSLIPIIFMFRSLWFVVWATSLWRKLRNSIRRGFVRLLTRPVCWSEKHRGKNKCTTHLEFIISVLLQKHNLPHFLKHSYNLGTHRKLIGTDRNFLIRWFISSKALNTNCQFSSALTRPDLAFIWLKLLPWWCLLLPCFLIPASQPHTIW